MDDASPTPGAPLRPPRDSIVDVIEPALQVGAACGGAGFLVGGAAGIVKGTAPFLFGLASGVQTFALGTTFWGIRGGIIEARYSKQQTPSDLVKASSISGGLTGGLVAFITRGRSNVVPGAVMMSLFGCLGQLASNRYNAPRDMSSEPKQGFWRRMSEKPFSPVTVLTNEQYAEMLREKMLKLEVEISIIEDKISALESQQRQEAEPITSSTTSGE